MDVAGSSPVSRSERHSGSSSGRAAPLDALTGLRFVAAAHVVWFHAGPQTGIGPLDRLRAYGWTAVSLFFMLSGFVLAYRHRDLDRAGLRAFWWARLVRIYPAYLAALAMSLSVGLFFPPPRWQLGGISSGASLVVEALLLQAWLPVGVRNLPGWSLSVECFFYLAFPWIIGRLARARRTPLVPVLLAGFAGAWLVMAVASLIARARPELDVAPMQRWSIWFNNLPLMRLPAFVIGVALGARFVDREGARARDARRAGATTLLGVLWCALPMTLLPTVSPAPELMTPLLLPGFALLIWGLAGGGGAIVGGVLGAPLALRLGALSYGVYLFQTPVSVALRRVVELPPWPNFLLYWCVLLSTAWLVFTCLEQPLRARARRVRTISAPPLRDPAR